MTTIKDVAREAGVSPATAARALGGYGYVKESTRRHVEEAARRLGYRPNALARSMVKRSTQTIGLVISDIANPFFPRVVRGIEDEAHARGFNVILCNSDEDPEKERSYLEVLLAKRVDGILVTSTEANAAHLESLARRHVPVVLLDRPLVAPGLDAVAVDNEAGARLAVEHLLTLGHRRIGMISGPRRVTTMAARIRGFERTLREHGLPLDPALIYEGDLREGGGYRGLIHLLSLPEPPTAVFTTDNRTTMGALAAARELGVNIPRALSLVAFDDTPWMQLFTPAVTVVEQPAYELGTAAARVLFERIGQPDHPPQRVQLACRLIVRESCAPPPALRREA